MFFDDPPGRTLPDVHVRMRFEDGAELWYQDPRRFGLMRLVETGRLATDRRGSELNPGEKPAQYHLVHRNWNHHGKS